MSGVLPTFCPQLIPADVENTQYPFPKSFGGLRNGIIFFWMGLLLSLSWNWLLNLSYIIYNGDTLFFGNEVVLHSFLT